MISREEFELAKKVYEHSIENADDAITAFMFGWHGVDFGKKQKENTGTGKNTMHKYKIVFHQGDPVEVTEEDNWERIQDVWTDSVGYSMSVGWVLFEVSDVRNIEYLGECKDCGKSTESKG